MFSISITMLSDWPSIICTYLTFGYSQLCVYAIKKSSISRLHDTFEGENSPTATFVRPGRSINVKFTTAVSRCTQISSN